MDTKHLYDFVDRCTSKCRILVVGDVMLDKYYYGEVNRISPEAPVPVTHVLRTKETLGGAANVAHNLALLGCETSIAGFVGEDYHCRSLRDQFKSCGVNCQGLITTDRPTTTKLRVIGGHQQMIRLDFEESAPIAGFDADRFFGISAENLMKILMLSLFLIMEKEPAQKKIAVRSFRPVMHVVYRLLWIPREQTGQSTLMRTILRRILKKSIRCLRNRFIMKTGLSRLRHIM